MSNDFVIKVLACFSKHDIHDYLFWRVKDGAVEFFVNCNDVFFWGCADAEDLTADSLPILEQAVIDTTAAVPHYGDIFATDLFVSRMRGMRPQTACYPGYPKELWPLFDACGPEREAGMGNPYTRERAEQEWINKHPQPATT